MSQFRAFVPGILVSVLATGVTLLLAEGAVRYITSKRLVYNIEMVRYARALKERDPLGVVSHVHRPSEAASLMGVDVSLNALGHRGPDLATPKPRGVRRVLVLGSSVTMGWGVPQEAVFTAVAERALNAGERRPRWEFANAGIGNYSTRFQRELFRRQYPLVTPDVVVLNYFISDVQPRGPGRDHLLLKHSYLAAWLFDRYSAWQFARQGRDLFSYYADFYRPESEAWRDTQADIRAMQEVCARDGVPFLVMLIPDIHDLSPDSPFAELYRTMEATFRADGFDTLNTYDAFRSRFGGNVSALWVQPDDPHPNADGHALMASLLVEHLQRIER